MKNKKTNEYGDYQNLTLEEFKSRDIKNQGNILTLELIKGTEKVIKIHQIMGEYLEEYLEIIARNSNRGHIEQVKASGLVENSIDELVFKQQVNLFMIFKQAEEILNLKNLFNKDLKKYADGLIENAELKNVSEGNSKMGRVMNVLGLMED